MSGSYLAAVIRCVLPAAWSKVHGGQAHLSWGRAWRFHKRNVAPADLALRRPLQVKRNDSSSGPARRFICVACFRPALGSSGPGCRKFRLRDGHRAGQVACHGWRIARHFFAGTVPPIEFGDDAASGCRNAFGPVEGREMIPLTSSHIERPGPCPVQALTPISANYQTSRVLDPALRLERERRANFLARRRGFPSLRHIGAGG